MKNKAVEYYKSGYSCSESIVNAAVDSGLCDSALKACATPFCAGMSSGCLCGTIAGAQMVLGYNFGKGNCKNNPECAREKAKEFVEEFKKRHKVTCCRVLTVGLEGAARKEHCTKLVAESAEILENLLKVKV